MTPRLGIRLSSGFWLRRWLICLSSSHGAILAGYKPYCKARHIYISWLGIFVSRFERDVKNASNTNVAKLVSDIRRSRVDGFISFLTADDKRYGFRFYRVIHLLWDLGWVGLGWLWLGYSSILSSCMAASARYYQPKQNWADSGTTKIKVRSRSRLITLYIIHPQIWWFFQGAHHGNWTQVPEPNFPLEGNLLSDV